MMVCKAWTRMTCSEWQPTKSGYPGSGGSERGILKGMRNVTVFVGTDEIFYPDITMRKEFMEQSRKGSYVCYVVLFFFFYYCMGAFGSVLSVYLTGIGIGIADLSLIVSASSLFGFVVIPAVGFFCDLTGKPRQIAAVLMIGIGIFSVLFSFSRQVRILLLLNGLAMSCINAVMPVLERIAGAARYRYGVLRIWGTIGYAAGAQAAGLFLQYAIPKLLFISVLVAGCLAAVGIVGADDPLTQKEQRNYTAGSGSILSLLKIRQYLLFLILAFLFWGCSGVNMTYIPILLTDLGIKTGGVGTVLLFSTLIEIPIILCSNTFMDRYSSRILMWAACSLSLAEFVTYGFSRSAPLVVAIVVTMKALATTLFMMITLKVVWCLVPADLTTTGLAVVTTCNSIGMIILQNLGGILVEKTSIPVFYRIMACIIVGIILLTFLLRADNKESIFG